MNELVVLADKEEEHFALEFSRYISKWFPQAHVIMRDYSHPEGAGRGNLVFAKIFFPRDDYYTLCGVVKAEGNEVFILSRGLDDHRQVMQDFGLEGVIFSWGPYGFYSDVPLKKHQRPSNIPLSAAELLKQYALGFEQLKQSRWENVLTPLLPSP